MMTSLAMEWVIYRTFDDNDDDYYYYYKTCKTHNFKQARVRLLGVTYTLCVRAGRHTLCTKGTTGLQVCWACEGHWLGWTRADWPQLVILPVAYICASDVCWCSEKKVATRPRHLANRDREILRLHLKDQIDGDNLMLCRIEFQIVETVNVKPHESDTESSGLSWIKGHKTCMPSHTQALNLSLLLYTNDCA